MYVGDRQEHYFDGYKCKFYESRVFLAANHDSCLYYIEWAHIVE